MKQWLFFDLGSTLLDEEETYQLFRESCVKVLQDAGQAVTVEEFEARMIDFAKENKDPVKQTWAYYNLVGATRPDWNHCTDTLFPAVSVVLEKLSKSYHLGVIANQQENLVERLEHFGILSYFKVVVGSADIGLSKPDLGIFEYALEQVAALPQDTIYVGDRIDNDMIPAKKMGMKTIWIKQGLGKYNQESKDYPCDWKISQIEELLEIL